MAFRKRFWSCGSSSLAQAWTRQLAELWRLIALVTVSKIQEYLKYDHSLDNLLLAVCNISTGQWLRLFPRTLCHHYAVDVSDYNRGSRPKNRRETTMCLIMELRGT